MLLTNVYNLVYANECTFLHTTVSLLRWLKLFIHILVFILDTVQENILLIDIYESRN